MNEIKIIVKNYGLIPDGEYNMHEGTIFFLKGPNNKGKTTFLHLLQSIMEVKDEKINPVRFGEKDGCATGSFLGADRKMYEFRYDFDATGKKKFTFLNQDGKPIKTTGEMRAIFNYTHITASDWLSMYATADGRKKQRETFINMMTPEERVTLADIDSKINAKDGTLYTKRTTLKTSIDTLKAQVDANVLSEEDREIFNGGVKAKELMAKLQKELDAKAAILDASSDNMKRRDELKTLSEDLLTDYDKDITEVDDEIQKLEEQLKAKREKREGIVSTFETKSKAYSDELLLIEKDLDVETLEKLKFEVEGSPITNPDGTPLSDEDYKKRTKGLRERITAGNKIITRYDQIIVLKADWAKTETNLKEKEAEWNKIDEEIKTLRDDKVKLIANSKGIPDRWGITDDYLTFDGVPFAVNDISTSKAIRAIADLMIRINDAAIMLMGDAEVLGYEVLGELKQVAEEYGRIMVFAEHDRNMEDVQLVCYDELDIPENKKPATKELF